MNTKKNLPLPLTKVLQNDDSHHYQVANISPYAHYFFSGDYHSITINRREYVAKSEVERDEFDRYWNSPLSSGEGRGEANGCRGILTGIAIMAFILALIMMGIMSCSPKQYAPVKSHNPHLRVNRSVDDPARSYQTINR